jgi:hypothetical protein
MHEQRRNKNTGVIINYFKVILIKKFIPRKPNVNSADKLRLQTQTLNVGINKEGPKVKPFIVLKAFKIAQKMHLATKYPSYCMVFNTPCY